MFLSNTHLSTAELTQAMLHSIINTHTCIGVAGGCTCNHIVTKNFYRHFFVGMRQNGAEFGEVHPRENSGYFTGHVLLPSQVRTQ